MRVVEIKLKVCHHNNLPFTVIDRVKKVWELVQERIVCIFVLFTVRGTVHTVQSD